MARPYKLNALPSGRAFLLIGIEISSDVSRL